MDALRSAFTQIEVSSFARKAVSRLSSTNGRARQIAPSCLDGKTVKKRADVAAFLLQAVWVQCGLSVQSWAEL